MARYDAGHLRLYTYRVPQATSPPRGWPTIIPQAITDSGASMLGKGSGWTGEAVERFVGGQPRARQRSD